MRWLGWQDPRRENLSVGMYSQKSMFADRKMFLTECASQQLSGPLIQSLEPFPREFYLGLLKENSLLSLLAAI